MPGPPKKDEVLVKVEAVALNPVDWRLQAGEYRPLFPSRLPYVTGSCEWQCAQAVLK